MTGAERPSAQPTLFPIDDPPPVPPAEAPAPVQKPPSRVRGHTCPNCVGMRLFVYRTRRPRAGKVVHYRECSACGYRAAFNEVFGHVLPPRETSRATSSADL